jgi:hypothetical protein
MGPDVLGYELPGIVLIMHCIQKEDIIGARIVDIHETYELSDGCDTQVIYFTVNRGFTFVTPIAGIKWTTIELPPNAKRLLDESVSDHFAVKRRWFGGMRLTRLPSIRDDRVKQIKQRLISGVYCGPFNKSLNFYYPDDGTIVFDDGSQASNTVVAPHGAGGAGLYFFPAGSEQCAPLDRMIDYFTIPLEKESKG